MTTLELPLDDPSFGELAQLAAAAHQPVDAFAENALREAVAAYRDRDYLSTRAARADDAAFAAILAKVPDVEPDPQDRWQAPGLAEQGSVRHVAGKVREFSNDGRIPEIFGTAHFLSATVSLEETECGLCAHAGVDLLVRRASD